jgi:hypothetical protein
VELVAVDLAGNATELHEVYTVDRCARPPEEDGGVWWEDAGPWPHPADAGQPFDEVHETGFWSCRVGAGVTSARPGWTAGLALLTLALVAIACHGRRRAASRGVARCPSRRGSPTHRDARTS